MNRYIAFLFALISLELYGQAGVSPAREVNITARSERSATKEVDISTILRPKAPANLEISDVTFSDQYGNSNSILDANEEHALTPLGDAVVGSVEDEDVDPVAELVCCVTAKLID